MSAPLTPGSFCWFELSTSDQNDAKRFYTSLFGWQLHDDDMGPAGVYTRFTIDSKDVAAACTLQPEQAKMGVPPNWMIYIMVADADQTAAAITAAGGTVIVPPFDVNDYGRMSVNQDPTGAMFCVWQTKTHAGVGITGVDNTVCWADLSTSDFAVASKFYASVFGWTFVKGENMGDATAADYAHIVNGDHMIGGVPPASARQPGVPPHWMLYFEVADCAASTTKAKSLGARAFVDSMKIADNRTISVLADPQGATFALHHAD